MHPQFGYQIFAQPYFRPALLGRPGKIKHIGQHFGIERRNFLQEFGGQLRQRGIIFGQRLQNIQQLLQIGPQPVCPAPELMQRTAPQPFPLFPVEAEETD